jgi:hypothetical protein
LYLARTICPQPRVGSRISFRKNSAEYTQNSFRYSAEESAYFEAFRSLRKSLFRSSNGNGMKKLVLQKILLQQTEMTACFHPRHTVLRNGISSCCLFRGKVWNKIPSVFLYFCSMKQNSELCSLPRNGSEWNSERLLLILFHGTEFRAFFSSAGHLGTESENFLFRGTAGIPPEQTNCSVYSDFRRKIFWAEIANSTPAGTICLPVVLAICPRILVVHIA